MLAKNRLLEEAEKLDDSEEVTNEEEIEPGKREKRRGRGRIPLRKKPFIKGCASSETAGEAPGARQGIKMKRNAKETGALDLPNGGDPAAGGLRDSYHRFAISVSLMRASR